MARWLPGLVSDPPLDPSAEEGRRLLREELGKLAYDTEGSVLDRLQRWVNERLEGLAGQGSDFVGRLLLLLLAAALVILAVLVVVRLRGGPRAARQGAVEGSVLGEESLTAEEYRARARAAEARGDHSAALLDWFRAIARSGDERALLDDQPGRTAHELVRALGPFFPGERAALVSAGDRFDDVRYGGRVVGEPEASTMRELDQVIARARPQHHAAHAEGDGLVAPGRWAR